MRVRELIANSVITEGPARSSAIPPRVTVTLPTFRRGDSGLLARAIDSILGQTFADFELIVVDDASTDSTAAVLEAAMRRDKRVSVIRHARNIGLPAVSEYEAFRAARGELFVFAFDDTVFAPDAIERLVAAGDKDPDAMVVGYVRWFRHDAGGELVSATLGEGACESDLLRGNVIANSAVILPRAILEDVGLYDPHVSLARLCDYDLWLRVRRRHRIRFIDAEVGEEHGPATSDSLGRTYPLDAWLSDDRMRQQRDASLRPDAFEDIDVFDTREFASPRSRARVEELAAQHRAARPWLPGRAVDDAPAVRVPRVLVVAESVDASVQTVFDALRGAPCLHVRIVESAGHLPRELVEADALVVARNVVGLGDWVEVARALGIPCFYYIDDHLPLMQREGELAGPFAIELLRDSLDGFAAVLVTTQPLAVSLRDEGLHDRVEAVGPSLPDWIETWRPPMTPSEPTVALFAGRHRLAAFTSIVMPALVEAAAARDARVRLLVPDFAVSELTSTSSVEVIPYPVSSDYFVALRTIRDLGADTLVLPPSRTANQRFKSPHPILSAAALGARLLAPAEEPYLSAEPMDGMTLIAEPFAPESWRRAFDVPLGDREIAGGVPVEVLRTRYSSHDTAGRLSRLLEPALEPETTEVERLRRYVRWLESRSASADAAASGDTTAWIAQTTHRLIRQSRRMNAFRSSRSNPLTVPGREGSIEVSEPLQLIPYLEYPVVLDPGSYASARVEILGIGQMGEYLGLEIVDPAGEIATGAFAPLPASAGTPHVDFRFAPLEVAVRGTYAVRLFTRSRHNIEILERVSRRWWGLRRPRVTAMIEFGD